jgi:tRNA (adenine57-N1/adenine58-N1)-methyltransferase
LNANNYREQPTGPFVVGDKVQLSGPKGKLYTITLVAGGAFGTHRGDIRHDDIIGKPEGSVIQNQHGVEYLALRPLLTDFVMSMPRGAAIIYPKDSAQIIVEADIFPGARVVEAGVGSGALSLYLLRAIGPSGRLDSFERRAEFADIARANVITHTGRDPENWDIHQGDLQLRLPEVVKEGQADRVVLDMLHGNVLNRWQQLWFLVDLCSVMLLRSLNYPGLLRPCARADILLNLRLGRVWSGAGTSKVSQCVRNTE